MSAEISAVDWREDVQVQDEATPAAMLRTASTAIRLVGALVRAADSNSTASPRSGTLSPRFRFSEGGASRGSGGSNPTTPDAGDRGTLPSPSLLLPSWVAGSLPVCLSSELVEIYHLAWRQPRMNAENIDDVTV